MTLLQIAPPAEEPLDIDAAKAHLRIDHVDEDVLIAALIAAARENVEAHLQRVLISQSWELICDNFPWAFALPLGKVTSVTSIKYLDADGVEQTVDAGVYETDLDRVPARIAPKNGKTWPSPGPFLNAVRVRYVVGEANAQAVPASIRQAMKLIVGGLYENRDQFFAGGAVAARRRP